MRSKKQLTDIAYVFKAHTRRIIAGQSIIADQITAYLLTDLIIPIKTAAGAGSE